MKFLVLTLCVCAASAASFGDYKPWQPQQQVTRAVAQVVQSPVVPEYKTYVPKPYAAKPIAQVVQSPVVPEYKTYVPKPYAAKPIAQVVQFPVVPEYKTYAPKPYAAKPIAPVVSIVPKPQYTPVAPVVAKTAYNGKEEDSAILRADSEVTDNGFNYFYETSNGISAQSIGTLKRVDDSNVIAVQGSYRYTAPDGTPVVFSYIADENGYQPQSDLIPVAPAIPEAIARSLEFIRAHPSKEQY